MNNHPPLSELLYREARHHRQAVLWQLLSSWRWPGLGLRRAPLYVKVV